MPAGYAVSLKHLYGRCSLVEILYVLHRMDARVESVVDERKIIFEVDDPERLADKLYSTASAEAFYEYYGSVEDLLEVRGRIRLVFGGFKSPEKAELLSLLRSRGVHLGEEGELYLVVKTREGVLVYRSLVEYRRDRFKPRSPENRVFFQSSALNPPSTLLLLSLTGAERGDRVLDPFAGTGSVLIEGALQGMYVVGVEIDYRQVRGALRNLRQYGLRAYTDMVLADSLYPPFRDGCFDAIATDPPYGRYSSTRRRPVDEIYSGLLRFSRRLLRGGRAVFYAPQWVRLPRCRGLVEECEIYVHSDLSRRLCVYDVGA